MPITPADLLLKFSVAAAAGDTDPSDGDSSLGDQCSTTQLASGVLHDLFDRVTGDENAASDVEYRCIFVHNAHGSLTWQSAKAWISSEVAGGADFAISVDTTPASAVGAAAPQAKTVADENTAPASQTFSAPADKASGLDLGDIGPGEVRAIWIRRSATNSAAVNADGFTLELEGDTGA